MQDQPVPTKGEEAGESQPKAEDHDANPKTETNTDSTTAAKTPEPTTAEQEKKDDSANSGRKLPVPGNVLSGGVARAATLFDDVASLTASRLKKRFPFVGQEEIPPEELPDIDCYKMTFTITKAEKLAPMDSNGLSDPYVEVKLHGETFLESNFIQNTLNPVWNEELILYADCTPDLGTITVLDHDYIGSNRPIGYGDMDFSSVALTEEFSTTIKLESLVDGHPHVGSLTYSYRAEKVTVPGITEVKTIFKDEDERPVSTMKQGLEAIQKASDFATVYAKKAAILTGLGEDAGQDVEYVPEVEINDIKTTGLPNDENFDITREELEDHQCYRITLEILHADNLAPMDKNGLADPFVEINLHKDLVLKTRFINRSLNPVWNETFVEYIDDRCALANINVLDHDNFGTNDQIGYFDLDLASVPPFNRYTTTINLGATDRNIKDAGSLTFSYLAEIVDKSWAKNIKSIGNKGEDRLLGVIHISVIEGIDLPPMNKDGTCDPFIRLQLGDKKMETRVIPGTLKPKWRENFEFLYRANSGTSIVASVWDSEVGLSNQFIGDTEIDLNEIRPNIPFKYVFGLDNTDTKITLMIKVLLFAKLGPTELQLQKEMSLFESQSLIDQYSLMNITRVSNVGYLIVKLIRATNISPKTIGYMDPYVILEVENCRSVSPVRQNCIDPEWNLTYRFPIKDYYSVLNLSLMDMEDLRPDAVVGRVAIPLFNCNGLKKYILKDAELSGIGNGELIVKTAFFYNTVRSAVQTFTPKEENVLHDNSASFSVSLFQRDVKRIKAQVAMVQDISEGIDDIFRWRSKPKSLISMIVFIVGVLYVELWMAPLALCLVLIYNNFIQSIGYSRKEAWVNSDATRAYYDIQIGEEGQSTGIGAKLDKFKAIFTTAETIQKGLDTVASIGEKFNHIGVWKVRLVSGLCCLVLFFASILLFFVNVRYVIIAWGLNKFRKFWFAPNLVCNNELADLLSRVPSFPEVQQYRQIRRRATSTRDTTSGSASSPLSVLKEE